MVAVNYPSVTDLLLAGMAQNGGLDGTGTPMSMTPAGGTMSGAPSYAGGLNTGMGQFLPTSNAPLPVPRPQVGLTALSGNQGQGVMPSPLAQMGGGGGGAGSGLAGYSNATTGSIPGGVPTASAGSSPFNTSNPNSFMSKLFGQSNAANQQPLIRNNSLVGRVAHLFMDQ